MSSLPPIPPLEYHTPEAPRPRRRIDIPLAITCGYAAAVLSAMLLFIVPYVWAMQARTMMDYGVKLPAVTTSLITFSQFCRNGGIILIWVIFALPPFVAAWAQPWRPADSRRRYFRPSRLIMTLIMALFCIWIVTGLVLPHVTLLDSLGSAGKPGQSR